MQRIHEEMQWSYKHTLIVRVGTNFLPLKKILFKKNTLEHFTMNKKQKKWGGVEAKKNLWEYREFFFSERGSFYPGVNVAVIE